jgi:hypothetical protein
LIGGERKLIEPEAVGDPQDLRETKEAKHGWVARALVDRVGGLRKRVGGCPFRWVA